MTSWTEMLVIPLLGFIASLLSPAEFSDETKHRIFETSFNTVITGLRTYGFRATYDKINLNESMDMIEANEIRISYPISILDWNGEICIPENFNKKNQLFPTSSDQFNDCYLNLYIKSFSLKNLGFNKNSNDNLLIEFSGIEFDLNVLSMFGSEEMAGLNLIASVITDDQKLRGNISVESGYNFKKDTTTLGIKIKFNNLLDLFIKSQVSNLSINSDEIAYEFNLNPGISFDFNNFELSIKDLGLRKLLEFIALSQTGEKVSSDLISWISPKNDADNKKLESLKKFLDGARQINCSRKTSLYFSYFMYEEMNYKELIDTNDPMFWINFFCEDLKNF